MEEREVLSATEMLAEDRNDLADKYLTFWSDHQLFGIPIAEVVQIVSMQHVTEIPEYPHYAKGIINLRGSIIPLIDVRLRLGKPETEYTDRTCIIVTSVQENEFGFIVDEVDEVTTIPAELISQPPQMGGETASTNRYLTGIARLPAQEGEQEKIVLSIATKKLLGEQEFEALTMGARQGADGPIL